VQRSEDRCDKRRCRGFNHSTCKTVLNQLEAVSLRFRKIVVERVTVVKFRADNRGSEGLMDRGGESCNGVRVAVVIKPNISLK